MLGEGGGCVWAGECMGRSGGVYGECMIWGRAERYGIHWRLEG